MADIPPRDPPDAAAEARDIPAASAETPVPDERPPTERIDRGLADFVRRAVSAGVGAASRSKDDIMRTAAIEMRTWLEHMNFSEEVAKALANMVIEVKTEIRFRPAEDGRLVPQASSDLKMKSSDS
jgi:hypothetical protein